MLNFNAITKTVNNVLSSDTVNKIKNKTTELYNSEVGQILTHEVQRSGEFQELQNKYGKYVDVWNERKNMVFNPEDLILNAAASAPTVTGSHGVGMATKSKNAQGLTYHPSEVMNAKVGINMPDSILRYPINETGDDYGPFMLFKAFKYTYDNYNKLGNTGNSTSMKIEDGETVDTQNELLTIIKLPMPAEVGNSLSLGYSDYNSLMAKLVRAAKTTSADDMKNLMMGIVDKGADSNTWADAGAVAAAGGLNALFSGSGGMISSAIGEGFDFVRVSAGISINPMQQSSYTGAGVSSHSFSFSLVPRNEKEAVEINKIIEKFQWLSIGEKMEGSAGLIVNYPAVWNVSFHAPNGQEITGMLSIPDAFITSAGAVYGASGSAAFKVTNSDKAWATAYTLNIELKEAQNPIRDDLNYMRQGGSLFGDEHPTTAQVTPNEWEGLGSFKAAGQAINSMWEVSKEAGDVLGGGEVPTKEVQAPPNNPTAVINPINGGTYQPTNTTSDDKTAARMREILKKKGYPKTAPVSNKYEAHTGAFGRVEIKTEVIDPTKTTWTAQEWARMNSNTKHLIVNNAVASGKKSITIVGSSAELLIAKTPATAIKGANTGGVEIVHKKG